MQMGIALASAGTSSELAYEQLRRAILSGELGPGAALVEVELCDRLGVSRTPVREALGRLAQGGLIRQSGRSLCVVGLSPVELDDAYRTRGALEGLAATIAAERQGRGELAPAALTRLGALTDAAHAHTVGRRFAEALEANRAFHLAIAELAGNDVVLTALVPIWDRILVTTRVRIEESATVSAVDLDHRAVIAAITAARPRSARSQAERHVDSTRRAMQAKESSRARAATNL